MNKTRRKKRRNHHKSRRGGGGCFSTPQGNEEEEEQKWNSYVDKAKKELKVKDIYIEFLENNAVNHGGGINVRSKTWNDGSCIVWPKIDVDLTKEQKNMLKIVAILQTTSIPKRFGSPQTRTPTPPGKFRPISPKSKGGKKKRKTRKRKRIGKNKKEQKRLQAQYRRFRKAKGDKRFKGTKGLIKWSRPSKSKKKGKKRSRRIYHRKRKTKKK